MLTKTDGALIPTCANTYGERGHVWHELIRGRRCCFPSDGAITPHRADLGDVSVMRILTLLCCAICIVAAGVGYWQPASAIAAAVFRVCLALLVSRAALRL